MKSSTNPLTLTISGVADTSTDWFNMAYYIVKVSPDRDAYLEWSTYTDTVAGIFTKNEYIEERPNEADRMDRADRYGSSANWPGVDPHKQIFGWNDEDFLVMSNPTQGFLPRTRLPDLYDLLDADIEAHIPSEWLAPLEDL